MSVVEANGFASCPRRVASIVFAVVVVEESHRLGLSVLGAS